MARLTRKTGMGDYGMMASPQTKEELQREIWKLLNRLGELEDEIEAEENEELAPLPFEDVGEPSERWMPRPFTDDPDPFDSIDAAIDAERWDK